jgi:hypothetical protein
MDSSPEIAELFEIAWIQYNADNTPVSRELAARAIVLGLQSLIAANIANASTVTQIFNTYGRARTRRLV